jgi:hypothetical protein
MVSVLSLAKALVVALGLGNGNVWPQWLYRWAVLRLRPRGMQYVQYKTPRFSASGMTTSLPCLIIMVMLDVPLLVSRIYHFAAQFLS